MYKITVGLEVHTELNTKSKIFSPAKNSYDLNPNTNVSPIDIALPGTLPTLNKKVFEKAIKLGKIFNMIISELIIFDRKNYYYPDLPKGYQITQQTLPIAQHGKYKMLNGKEIRIHDIHIEEDTAGLDHFDGFTLIDYNRCGVPLLEIVTEPDFENLEAVEFLEDLRLILKNADISEADITKGHIRCDVNVSVSKTDTLGVKVEVKGVDSIANVKKVIEAESTRQIELLEKGEEILQETRRYDEKTNTTILMRTKEDAIDYRYFVEPNIPIFTLPKTFIDSIENDITLPNDLLNKYVNDYKIDLVNAKKIIKDNGLINYFETLINLDIDPTTAINLITGPISEYLNKKNINITNYYLKPTDLKTIIELNNNGDLSSKQMKEIILKINEEKIPVEKFIKKYNLVQINNEEELTSIINEVLENNKDKLELYKAGKTNTFNFFIGAVMKQTNGNCNPVKTRKILESILKGEE